MRKQLAWLVGGLTVASLITPGLALETSVGEGGINARRLHSPPYDLRGRKIGIGQVEVGRPSKFGLDKASSQHPVLSVYDVFHRDEPAKANMLVDAHAAMVAMVMVSHDKRLQGVAPEARLYASAVGSLQGGGQPQECVSSQHVALQNGGDVRAINFSFGEPLNRDPRENPVLDGNALLTRCIDWSARVHNVLYVIAGNQGGGGIPIPTDNYNGINVASTMKRDGEYRKLDFSNLSDLPIGIGRLLIEQEINIGGRRAINLVAPGNHVEVYNLEGRQVPVTGTSFAAPHVTATVALLQEFGDRQLEANISQWSIDSRRSEVMRAVLLNSADKVKDTGNGLFLGMERTILDKDNLTWLDGDAAREPETPLDIEMGTGQLNAFRAYQQFSGGQWSPESDVPPIGWDYGTVSARMTQEYVLAQPLSGGSRAAITLTWQRRVELEDRNGNELYDPGESFRDRGLNDLNIALVPLDGNAAATRTCASMSEVDSIEHIFCEVPQTGRYKIRVQYQRQVHEAEQSYAIAWWTKPNS
ncbi:MAG: S8 family serine peptidase [Jaaginema sp. PMC 1079.18]|nr:S8 family serine peptidase [Jaaginema sp. PMC 1080.18]MEC4852246.1 S8 family serine peptidase [Jaaginema sp. PMC 1079.18]MEC4865084.1 S8 family serine peptidase [Jaaginema sp. PMC 1078.18]